MEVLLRHAIAHLLEPASVIKNNEDIIVDFLFREEDGVTAAPLFDLLVDQTGLVVRDKVAQFDIQVLSPHRCCLDIAMIVIVGVEDEDIELGVGYEAKLRRSHHSLDVDLVHRLGDICVEIVIVETFTGEAELREGAIRDLKLGTDKQGQGQGQSPSSDKLSL